jgi:hemerythrin superfamily protein
MDFTRLLEADHRQVEDLFDKIEKAGGEQRRPLIDELTDALQAHMQLEEQVLYPAMGPVTGEEAVLEANTEHDLARKILADVLALAPDEPGFGAALDAAKAGISHHVREEEGEIFPKLRKDASVLGRIEPEFLSMRNELGLPTDATAIAAATSKRDLQSTARDAGVAGSSSMTKTQLADAVAAELGMD